MSTVKTSNIANLSGTSTSVENVLNGTAKAWVNFNGTGTVAIRASYNVSSITDIGTGIYTVNFTTPMIDANYSASINVANSGTTWSFVNFNTTANYLSTGFSFLTVSNTITAWDSTLLTASVFR